MIRVIKIVITAVIIIIINMIFTLFHLNQLGRLIPAILVCAIGGTAISALWNFPLKVKQEYGQSQEHEGQETADVKKELAQGLCSCAVIVLIAALIIFVLCLLPSFLI